jgi:thiamine biosynthesis lipoprotein
MDRRQALRITAVAGTGLALGGGLVAGVLRRAGLHRVSESRTRMGTVVTITVVHPEADEARRMVGASFEEMERLESVLSRHRPDTPLSRLNTTGLLSDPPPELVEVVERAEAYSVLSDGAFDVTVKPLLDLYGAAFDGGDRPPSERDVRAARALVDHRGVRIEGDAIRLADPRMSITLDGIAKGYIVDRTIDVLVASGADRVMVNAGGDMASAGDGSVDDPWTVSIQDPRDERRYVELVRLAGDCIATSGDYMRTFTEDRRFHHIIDPRTGYSPTHTSSVSVLAPTAMDADALSTAVLVLGPVEGRALLEGLRGVEGVVVGKDGVQVRTSGMRRHVVPA